MSSSSLGTGFDVGVEVEEKDSRLEGQLPALVNVAWQKTEDYQRVKKFLLETRGAVIISEAQCVTHKVRYV